MKISVDGGGLCTDKDKRFGNYTFTTNFLQALNKYDKKNEYFVYTFCNKYYNLSPKKFWMKGRVTLEEIINKKDIFLALNQALPLYTHAKIISFSHGLSFYFYPEHYSADYSRLKNQLNEMIKRSKYIIVSSQRVKDELINKVGVGCYRPDLRIIVIPFGIPFDMEDQSLQKREKYFMFAGMNTSIKNIDFLKKAFNEFNSKGDYKLHVIDSKIKREELKKMYSKAAGYLSASYYESFNFPILEALSQECPVVALKSAVIPEMEGYVQIAYNKDDFVKNMLAVADGKYKKIDRIKLMKDFSWVNYIKKLQNLY